MIRRSPGILHLPGGQDHKLCSPPARTIFGPMFLPEKCHLSLINPRQFSSWGNILALGSNAASGVRRLLTIERCSLELSGGEHFSTRVVLL